MAVTEFTTSSPQAVKVWSDETWVDTIHKTEISRFMGTDDNSIIRRLTDLEKGRGDVIYFDVRLQLDDWGVVDSAKLEGNEDSLEFAQDSLTLHQRRMGVAKRRFSQQRTIHDLRMHCQDALTDKWADYLDNLMYAQLAGRAQETTGLSAAYVAEGRTPVAPDADHVYDPSATMSLAHIDRLVEMAKTRTPIMRPAMVDGEPKFILSLHPAAVRGLRTASGGTEWTEITKSAGVRGSDNPIYTGALGEYAGVIIHESTRIPYNSSTTPRCHNVFMGAGAGAIGFGNAYSGLGDGSSTRVEALSTWWEEVRDFGEEMAVATGNIYGIKKVQFDMNANGTKTDYGTIVLQTDDVKA